MLAYDYPMLGAFLTMMFFFVWVIWLFLLFKVVIDIFRSDDLGGFSKALWLLFVIFRRTSACSSTSSHAATR